MRHYAYHPICSLFSEMSPEEIQEFATDIKAKGLLHPIILYEGKILDGRNHYLACGMAGVEPRFVEWQGKGSPLQWVISDNVVRRHLTSSQKAVLALELVPGVNSGDIHLLRTMLRFRSTFLRLEGTAKHLFEPSNECLVSAGDQGLHRNLASRLHRYRRGGTSLSLRRAWLRRPPRPSLRLRDVPPNATRC